MAVAINLARVTARRNIYRSMLMAERTALFVFGDNLARKGYGGQAKVMRGEPNAVGIPTKRRPSMDEDAFFTDADFAEVQPIIDQAFQRLRAHVAAGGRVVFPAAGIGNGLAELPQRAPRIYAYIEMQIGLMMTDYGQR